MCQDVQEKLQTPTVPFRVTVLLVKSPPSLHLKKARQVNSLQSALQSVLSICTELCNHKYVP